MNFDKYEVGDRVVFVGDQAPDGGSVETGMTGTVCNIYENSAPHIGVCWDEEIPGGHHCHNTCKYGHGWYVHEYQLEIVESPQQEMEPATEEEICSMFGL